MYSSEDLERFYLDYQSEWVPRGMTLQTYCSRNNVPYKVMENYSRNIQKKIVEVKVVWMLIQRKHLPHIQTADTLIQRVLIIWAVLRNFR